MKVENFGLICLCTGLAACSVGPDYERPELSVPSAYKELSVDWRPIDPKDELDRGAWWMLFKDERLNDLESQIAISNQNIKAAEAAVREAKAMVFEARTSFLPSVDLSGDTTKSGGAASTSVHKTRYMATATGGWDVDVWGKIRRSVEGASAGADLAEADLANARLSAQAELANDYFDLRAEDELQKVSTLRLAAYEKTFSIIQNKYRAGTLSKADLASAEAEVENARATAMQVSVNRAKVEHAIAVLLGKTPAEFKIEVAESSAVVPVVPVGLPSALLERRPDVAAAEHSLRAANANVGEAIAGYFPNLSLSGSYGYSSGVLGSLFGASTTLWSYGPAVAVNLMDMGAQRARVRQADASYDHAVATYRQTVLEAFQNVEDQITSAQSLAAQSKAQDKGLDAAKEAEQHAVRQYDVGVISFSDVVDVTLTRLSQEESAVTTKRDQLVASVDLIKALGGGWKDPALAEE